MGHNIRTFSCLETPILWELRFVFFDNIFLLIFSVFFCLKWFCFLCNQGFDERRQDGELLNQARKAQQKHVLREAAKDEVASRFRRSRLAHLCFSRTCFQRFHYNFFYFLIYVSATCLFCCQGWCLAVEQRKSNVKVNRSQLCFSLEQVVVNRDAELLRRVIAAWHAVLY